MNIKTIYLPSNLGHGNARRISLNECSNEIIALMDADDLSLPNRFELQIDHLVKNPTVDIVGGQISEFIGEPSNVVAVRSVLMSDDEIRSDLKVRCPMNQVSVMFRREAYNRAGGYVDWYCNEDYYLWIRMHECGCHFANVDEVVVNVRVGNEMSARRGGMKYFSSEERIQRYMLRHRIISLPRYLYNTAIRFGGQVLLPPSLRTKMFKYFRSKLDGELYDTKAEVVSKPSQLPFSVAMCVYGKDNPEWFDMALNSVINQTVKPNEIVLVVDGPIPDSIKNVIEKYSQQ